MKLFNKPIQTIAAACFSVLLLASCKKNDLIPAGGGANTGGGGGNPGNSNGKVTAIGTPAGNAESKIIGAGGGSFTSSDGRITIDFPAGALNADQVISIQPISSMVSGASGNAYRITPHNVNFNLPVKISFNYGDADLLNTIPAGMAIAYQDAQQVWQAVGGGTNDTTNRKIWVFTSHFSDWALFKKYLLVPELAFIAPGASLNLGVIRTADLDGDLEIPPIGTPVKDSLAAVIKEWRLGGEGTLTANGSNAVYKAPAQAPAKNPVAVSVTLNSTGTWKVMLVTNIYIGGEGITFRIDNGAWMTAQCPLGATTVAGITQISGSPIVNNAPMGAVALKWKSIPVLTNVDWGYTPPNVYPQFSYAPGGTVNFWHFYEQNQTVHKSPGGLYMFRTQNAGGYVSGIFILEKSGRSEVVNNTTVWTIHRIDGFFNVKVP